MLYCNKKKIVDEIRLCNSILSKAIGLMFSFPIKDKGLVFIFDKPVRESLHMFFVFYPIDVLFLDEEKRILEMKERFLPFTVFFPEKKAKYIIELPNNTIKRKEIKIGNQMSW